MAVTTRGGKSDEPETKGGAGKKRPCAVKKTKRKKSDGKRKKSDGKTNRLALVNIPESEVHSDREYCSV